LSLGIDYTAHSHSVHLTTAALTDHSHGAAVTTATVGTEIEMSSASSGMTIYVPSFITTATGLKAASIGGNSTSAGDGYSNVNSGTVIFAGGNNITLSQDGSVVTISGAAQGGVQTGISGIAGSAASTVTNGTIQFSNDHGVSFGLDGSTMTASVLQSVQTQNVWNLSLSGNTSGTMTQVSSQTLTLAGGNNITLSQAGNAITISGAEQGGVQTGISGIQASDATFSSGTIIFTASNNNLTIGTSVNGASQYVHLSVGEYLTTAAGISHEHGSIATVTVNTNVSKMQSTSASSGITLGIPAWITTAMQSDSSNNFAKTGLTTASYSNSTLAATLNTEGLNLLIPKWITNGETGDHTHSDVNGTNISTVFTAGTAMTITADSIGATYAIPAWITTGALISHSHGNPTLALTNITGTTASTSNGFTLSLSGNSSGNVQFADSNGISFGASTSGSSTTITALHNAYSTSSQLTSMFTKFAGILTTGVTGADATINSSQIQVDIPQGSLYFNDSNGVSFGASTSGLSTTLTAMNGPLLSNYIHPSGEFTSINNMGQGSLSVKHMYVPFNVTGSAAKLAILLLPSTNTSVTTASANLSVAMGIYTLNGSTLSLASSGSANNAFVWSQSNSTTGNTSISGYRQITVPVDVNMTPGEYWVAALINSATTYTGASIVIHGGDLLPSDVVAIAPIGSNTSVANMIIPYQGIYTTVTTAMPTNIVKTGINYTSASNAERANFYNAIYNNNY